MTLSSAPRQRGDTAVHVAVKAGKPRLVQLLAKFGADVNIENKVKINLSYAISKKALFFQHV